MDHKQSKFLSTNAIMFAYPIQRNFEMFWRYVSNKYDG